MARRILWASLALAPVAFAARYGSSSANVLGTYSGSLDNSGERVTLTDPLGQTAESFTYDPAWYPQTGGGGNSLVVVDPAGDTAALDTAAGWRAPPCRLPQYVDLAHHTPVAFKCSRRVTGDSHHVAQMKVAARASDHQVEVAWLDDTLASSIGEIEHVHGQLHANACRGARR